MLQKDNNDDLFHNVEITNGSGNMNMKKELDSFVKNDTLFIAKGEGKIR